MSELSAEPKDVNTDAKMRLASEKTSAFDHYTELASEWCSPILVKEARQALKSRQFLWTFFLLLIAVGLWTLIGLTISYNDLSTEDAGPTLLAGYCWILGFPLGIVIPFGAYRSLAREFDDGTIQLISISTMRSWEIVLGKLGSTCLQMLVYLAILAPCISFTYLLRGISVAQISLTMGFCVLGSLCFSALGLFLAGAIRSRIYSAGISVVLIIGLAFAYFGWCNLSYFIAQDENDIMMLVRPEGQFVLFGMAAFALSFGLLFLASASVQISFAADNRSTLPRIMMLIQQTLFLAWSICLLTYVMEYEAIVFMAFVYGHYWLIMGCLLVGESTELSARVRRQIPETIGMRSLFSLFIPGPGRGLIFAVTNLWICGAVLMIVAALNDAILPSPEFTSRNLVWSGGRTPLIGAEYSQALCGTVVACFYITLFLTIIFLVMAFLRRRLAQNGPLLSLLLGIVMVAGLTTAALLIQFNFLPGNLRDDYSVVQFANWYWTTFEATENNRMDLAFGFGVFALLAAIPIFAALTAAARELLTEHAAVPERVQADEEQLKLERRPVPEETIDDIFNAPRDDDESGA